jgi:hypothetical protein
MPMFRECGNRMGLSSPPVWQRRGSLGLHGVDNLTDIALVVLHRMANSFLTRPFSSIWAISIGPSPRILHACPFIRGKRALSKGKRRFCTRNFGYSYRLMSHHICVLLGYGVGNSTRVLFLARDGRCSRHSVKTTKKWSYASLGNIEGLNAVARS